MKFSFSTIAATTALALTATFAQAAPVQINEQNLGVGAYVVNNVGKLNGSYIENLTINNDATMTSGPTFTAAAYATFTSYVYDGGGVVPTFGANKATSLGTSYNLVAAFTSTGVVTSPTSFGGGDGQFKLYIDAGGDAAATFGYTAGLRTVSVAGSNLIEIASSDTMTFGEGTGVGSNASAFKFLFNPVNLTNAGKMFFTDPVPFFMEVNINGDFDNGLNATAPGNYLGVEGDLSAEFSNQEVPEPASLALVGVALAGLGLARRRKIQAK